MDKILYLISLIFGLDFPLGIQTTMRPVQVHEPVYMNLHNQSLMNCVLIGKTPGIVISLLQDAPKGFSGPNILNF